MRRSLEPRVQWKINLPLALAARIELRLPGNAANTAPAYAVRSKLIEDLLRRWVEDREAQHDADVGAAAVVGAIPEGTA